MSTNKLPNEPVPAAEDRTITINEACKRLRIGRNQLYRIVAGWWEPSIDRGFIREEEVDDIFLQLLDRRQAIIALYDELGTPHDKRLYTEESYAKEIKKHTKGWR